MPQYLSPGVYVEEIDAGPKPIEGVSTSVCGAVGMTATGPTSGKPVLVTSFNDFTRTFGGFWPVQDRATINNWTGRGAAWWQFPLLVKSFFDNGGQLLYVKRVVSSQATSASADYGTGLTSALVQDTAADTDTLRLAHVIGVKPGDKVHIATGGGSDPGPEFTTLRNTEFTVTAVNDSAGTVTLNPRVPLALSVRRGDFLWLQSFVKPANPTLTFKAKASGGGANGVLVRLDPMVGNTYNILADAGLAPRPAIVVQVAENTPKSPDGKIKVTGGADIGDLKTGQHVLLRNVEFVLDTVTAPAAGETETTLTLKDLAGVAATPAASRGDRITQIRPANAPAGPPAGPAKNTLNIWGASATLYKTAIVEISNGVTKEIAQVTDIAGNKVTFGSDLKSTYFEGQRVRVIEAQVSTQYTPVSSTPVEEVFSGLRLNDDGSPLVMTTFVNSRSALIEIDTGTLNLGGPAAPALSNFPAAATGTWAALAGGDDALGSLSLDDFIGFDGGSGKRTGIQALEDIDDISICAVPGVWAPDVQAALITHCELLRSRFAILDPPDGLGIEQVRDFRAPIDTKYAALYYPWVIGRDPAAAKDTRLAPSLHMAGIYARVDNDRGVHKAPANETILGINALGADVTKREHDRLNPANINALRFFPGRGLLVYGARCLTSNTSWKYINVRRLFIYVEQSIERGTQWVVFEPNDEPLWARVRQSITNFLTTVWRDGALQGGKPAEAFFVKCDRTTMTQDDIDNGRLICLIGIAPVKPAEFVIFRIQQKALDQTTP
jgi:phage tail sheath protein FI